MHEESFKTNQVQVISTEKKKKGTDWNGVSLKKIKKKKKKSCKRMPMIQNMEEPKIRIILPQVKKNSEKRIPNVKPKVKGKSSQISTAI